MQMQPLEIVLLAASLLIVPLILLAGFYALSWAVLCAVRFIPLVGRKHRKGARLASHPR
jgi:hypothetical protein